MANSQNKVADKFYSSKSWIALRKRVLERDGYKCQHCGIIADSSYLQADHIIDRSILPQGTFVIENIQTLCRPCHTAKTFGRKAKIKPMASLTGLPEGW